MSGSDKKRAPRQVREKAKAPCPPVSASGASGRILGGILFYVWRILFVIALLSAGYVFWPRTPSISAFEPSRMGQLQVHVWRCAKARHRWELFVDYYKIYAGQYGAYPYSALRMAKSSSDAVAIFQSAPDAADQEKALEPIGKVFDLLTTQTKATFDPHAAAQMELQIWSLRANGSYAELTRALSEQLALIYGRPADDCVLAAKKIVLAMRSADRGQWSEAVAQNKAAWAKMKPVAKALQVQDPRAL